MCDWRYAVCIDLDNVEHQVWTDGLSVESVKLRNSREIVWNGLSMKSKSDSAQNPFIFLSCKRS